MTPGQRWAVGLLVAVAAIVVARWDDAPQSDTPGAGPAAGLKVDSDPERTTSAPMANPFSTFQLASGGMGAPPSSQSVTPPVPFAYAGTRIEGSKTVVILSQQGRSVAVQGPGMLDAMYEVESIDARQVVLVYLPLMTRQVVALPGTRAVADSAPVAPPPGSTESDTEPDN